MFLHVSVILSMGGGCLVPGVPGPGGSGPGGVPGPGGCWGLLPGGGLVWGVPGGSPGTATAADGTHPTGMHSCLCLKIDPLPKYNVG